MRAKEFILTESRNYLCEAYQRQTVTLIEQFCKQSVTHKFTPRQIFEMFEAVPANSQPAPKEVVALQQGKKVLGKAKASLAHGIQRSGEKVQDFDEKFDAYATKLAEKFPATNEVIQAFRKWGHEHPVAEHAILFALGTAATVVTPGVIGAAVAVGLLTTAYKLIMGKKFSQSVKAGAAAGLIAGALSSAVHGVEALAHAHHASPALTKGAESIAHGAIEHTAGDTIGDIAAKGADMVGDLVKSSSGIRGAASAARAGNYSGALNHIAAT
jgi:hypothetical protein